jgi:2-oxoglutarate/2-oxoacid ferredoxin oxidoreductase subunit beta
VLRAAAAHRGAALVEIYQNCNVFNDGAFDAVRGKGREGNQIRLRTGEPIRFGPEGQRGVVRGADGQLRLAEIAEVGEEELVVHDPHEPNPSQAFALAHLAERPTGPTPIGVFRDVERPVYGSEAGPDATAAQQTPDASELDGVLRSGDTWTVA